MYKALSMAKRYFIETAFFPNRPSINSIDLINECLQFALLSKISEHSILINNNKYYWWSPIDFVIVFPNFMLFAKECVLCTCFVHCWMQIVLRKCFLPCCATCKPIQQQQNQNNIPYKWYIVCDNGVFHSYRFKMRRQTFKTVQIEPNPKIFISKCTMVLVG